MTTGTNSPPRETSPAIAVPWLPDRGDGTYRNPILFADYSDPDAIRVDGDYWLISSSFGHVPGLPILHSRDLVNWTLVNHALPRLVPHEHFSSPRHGQGVWAPSIRFHEGRFWIFYADPDFGIHVLTADDPREKWSEPRLVKPGRGLIDPCPFWDTDGAGYLVHAWAKSRSGVNNRLTLHRLRTDNHGVIDPGVVIIDGNAMPGWSTIEGPKLYKRGGYYYIFAPAGGVTDGYQAVFRSRDLYGSYESRRVLARGATSINGPHQGAWLDTPHGSHWFLHFQEMPAYGRVVHLQPMQWRDDWPVIGNDSDGDGTGEPVIAAAVPHASASHPIGPATADEFERPSLGLQWQWQANPAPDWMSLAARPGFLRLRCVPHQATESLWLAAHLLMQKFPAPEFTATTLLELSPERDGDAAGLVVFGMSYAWIGLQREAGRLRLVHHRCEDAHQGGAELELASLPVDSTTVYLRVTVGAGARCSFSFSSDGVSFRTLDGAFQARSSYWVGAKVGLFASTRADETTTRGHADFAWFRIGPPSS